MAFISFLLITHKFPSLYCFPVYTYMCLHTTNFIDNARTLRFVLSRNRMRPLCSLPPVTWVQVVYTVFILRKNHQFIFSLLLHLHTPIIESIAVAHLLRPFCFLLPTTALEQVFLRGGSPSIITIQSICHAIWALHHAWSYSSSITIVRSTCCAIRAICHPRSCR
jgi:hypothetical protein